MNPTFHLQTNFRPIAWKIPKANYWPIGQKFRSLVFAAGRGKSRFKAGNCFLVLVPSQVFEFQPGVRILERDWIGDARQRPQARQLIKRQATNNVKAGFIPRLSCAMKYSSRPRAFDQLAIKGSA